jgi:hypothetical protein
MPAIPRQAESYTKPWVQQGKAGRLCVAIYPPTSNMDQHLRTQQHLNNYGYSGKRIQITGSDNRIRQNRPA